MLPCTASRGRLPLTPLLSSTLLLSSLLSGGLATAQPAAVPAPTPQPSSTPFTPGAPGGSRAELRPGSAQVLPTTTAPGSLPAAGIPTAGIPTPSIPTPGVRATFGPPRLNVEGTRTRVVYDLPAGSRYSLTPTFGGLRIDVSGAATVPGRQQLGAAPSGSTTSSSISSSSVTSGSVVSVSLERTPAGGVALITTPYPLAPRDGWTAHETTIGSGGRVLVLEFSSGLSGGPDSTVTGEVLVSAPVTADSVLPLTPAARAPVTASETAPGDQAPPLNPAALPPPTLPLGDAGTAPNVMAGTAEGTVISGASIPPPRLGKNPGLTRFVLDLPPGSSFRISLLPLGLRIDVSGSSTPAVSQVGVSPELRAYSGGPSLTGASYTLTSVAPLSAQGGWRGVLLPPVSGRSASRLAIDLSPALADTTPLPLSARSVARVVSRSAVQTFSGVGSAPRVVLDPGHGGHDPGAIGSVVEKDVNLKVARLVRDYLIRAGIEVLMTRDGDSELNADKSTDLALRAGLGGPPTQLYVSIHVNSTDARSLLQGYGIETWWNNNNPQSQTLASSLQRSLLNTTSAYSRGLKNNKSLGVLRQSRVPAALVEIGYASHPIDGQNLKDANYLDRVALGVATGIRDALSSGVGMKWPQGASTH